MRHRSIEERFAEKYVINPETNCWEWTGAKVAGGYGMLGRYHGSGVLAHRFSYEMHFGPVPEGQIVRHSCDNPACVNPSHLMLGTHAENMRDMVHKGRRIGRGSGTSLSNEQLLRLKDMVEHGHTQREIATVLGVNRSTVQRVFARSEVRVTVEISLPSTDRKKQNSRVYLTDEQRAEAIRMLADGERVMTVAKAFGVDRKTIRNLRPNDIPRPPRGRPRSSSPLKGTLQ